MNDIYVVVSQNEVTQGQIFDQDGPLVFEQYIKTSDLESVRKRALALSVKYGKCKIARLCFIDD